VLTFGSHCENIRACLVLNWDVVSEWNSKNAAIAEREDQKEEGTNMDDYLLGG